jgi:Ser/Thr protein kinase RdoA (MazF antagonist)
MLLAGDAPSMAAQLHALLAGYEVFMPFDRRELALIEPLRLVRMMRHNAWVARRWSDPAFPLAYPDFGTSAYWAQQCTQLREQTATARDGPPLAELL